jgi:hypothetical protein
MSVFPDPVTGGGVVYRDAAGNCLNPPDVQNAYCPAPAFVIENCEPTALPANCEARVEPKQINSIVSELLALAECFDANGPWDCHSLNNFNTWAAAHDPNLFVKKAGDTMTGPLILSQDPEDPMGAVNLQYLIDNYTFPDITDAGTF